MDSMRRWTLVGAMCLGGFGMIMNATGCGHEHREWVDEHTGYRHTGYYDSNHVWHGGYNDEHGAWHDDPGDFHH